MHVFPNTIVLYGDLACPWATLATYRLHEARARLGLGDRVRLDHRPFPLELFNERPTPRRIVEAEIPVVGALAPAFGWQLWEGDPFGYPGTVLLALEAVEAAKEQSLLASEQLDLALRRAFFAESRHIGMRHVILEVAARCPDVDAEALCHVLDAGRARQEVVRQKELAPAEGVKGSPHLFLPDGTDVHNPGIRMSWEGEKPGGFPVIHADDPSVYDDLLRRAAE